MASKQTREPVVRTFTLELSSASNVKRLSASSTSHRISLEGAIGTLKSAQFVDDMVLEVVGTEGVIRVDLSKDDLIPPSSGQKDARGANQ